MEFTRETVRLALYVTGPLVLAAYVFGISRMESPNDLWGGNPSRKWITNDSRKWQNYG